METRKSSKSHEFPYKLEFQKNPHLLREKRCESFKFFVNNLNHLLFENIKFVIGRKINGRKL